MIKISKHKLGFRSRDKPVRDSLNGSQYSFYFGPTTSGKPVNERTAMQITAVYACVRILSEAIAGLPLHLYRYDGSGGKVKAIEHPLYRLLHDEPNPEMTSFAFRETLMGHLLLWGNAYAQIIRNGKGEVLALYPLMPDKMTVDRKIPLVSATGEAAWVEEEALITDSDDAFGQMSLGAHKLATMIKVSEELLNDLAFGLEPFISRQFAKRIGVKEENAFILGSGSSKPTGLLNETSGAQTGVTTAVTALPAASLLTMCRRHSRYGTRSICC